MFRSVRARLTLWYVAAASVFLAGFVALDYWSLRNNLLDRVDARLGSTAQDLAATVRGLAAGWSAAPEQVAELRTALTRGLAGERGLAAVAAADGAVLAVGPLAEHAAGLDMLTPGGDGPAAFVALDLAGEPVRAAALPATDGAGATHVLRVAVSLAAVHDTLAEGLVEHIGMSLGLILVISLLGLLIINRALEPVRRSYEQVRRFSADVAHELNTPLTVLRGEIEVALRQERSPAEYRERLGSLLDEVDRLARIVDDLLLLASLDAGAPPAFTGVALERVLLEAHEEVYQLAAQRQVALEFDSTDAEVTVRGDATLLRRLVVNLLTNAIKFSPAGGRVALGLTRETGAATVTVRDSGVGIPSAAQAQLFERFYRADPSRTADGQAGAGLGLAIVKQVADLHGCAVALESTEGQGTTVTVRWAI